MKRWEVVGVLLIGVMLCVGMVIFAYLENRAEHINDVPAQGGLEFKYED